MVYCIVPERAIVNWNMQKAKKVKVNMNPKRVQNPYDQYKRSPGKFDQKVWSNHNDATRHSTNIFSGFCSLRLYIKLYLVSASLY